MTTEPKTRKAPIVQAMARHQLRKPAIVHPHGKVRALGIVSWISPISTRMTWTALPITSAGRFSPLEDRSAYRQSFRLDGFDHRS